MSGHMNEPPVLSAKSCPHCQALNDTRAPICWLCKQPLPENPWRDSGTVQPAENKDWNALDYFFMALLLICFGLTVLVGIGICQGDRGMLIPLVIVCAPAYAAVFIRMGIQAAAGEKPSPAKGFVWFIASFMITIGIIAILILAAIVAAIATCFAALK